MRDNNIKIRYAEFTDIEQILHIEQETIKSWTYSQFLDELNKPYSLILVYEDNKQITGYLSAWIVSGEIEIISFAVQRELKGKGVSTQLLRKLEKISNENHISSIFLEVRSRNIQAIKFYSKNGFNSTGTRKNYYIDDDAILMEKRL